MSVDVDHVYGLSASVKHGCLECPGRSKAFRIRGSDVVGIGGDSGAGKFGIDTGAAGQGVFLGFHTYTRYVKVTFFRGTSLDPVPAGKSKHPEVRYLDIREGQLDEAAELFEQITTDDQYVEFLTLPAYKLID